MEISTGDSSCYNFACTISSGCVSIFLTLFLLETCILNPYYLTSPSQAQALALATAPAARPPPHAVVVLSPLLAAAASTTLVQAPTPSSTTRPALTPTPSPTTMARPATRPRTRLTSPVATLMSLLRSARARRRTMRSRAVRSAVTLLVTVALWREKKSAPL
jgi:hypothetical protein